MDGRRIWIWWGIVKSLQQKLMRFHTASDSFYSNNMEMRLFDAYQFIITA